MRQLKQIYTARPSQDGDGVKIHRLAGRELQAVLNPFLMLDEIRSDEAADYIGGFPEHPHRGFETITYMKAGRMRHRDHMGNEGVIEAGDMQWMTAGAGVLHSEMPEQEEGLFHGFQLWLNLPAKEKMQAASYISLQAQELPCRSLPGGGEVVMLAGRVVINAEAIEGEIIEGERIEGLIADKSTEPVLMDVSLAAGEAVQLEFGAHRDALVYVYQGALVQLRSGQLGVFSAGETLNLQAGASPTAMLVLSGKPLNEPIAQYGPFVMNTSEELEQAFDDYRNNRLHLSA